jgi:hypothetical protein
MGKSIVIIKIDPLKRKIARMAIKPTTRGVTSILGPGIKRHRVILDDVNGEKLIVGCRVDRDEAKKEKEWRFRGCDNFAGVGILFGSRNRDMEYMGNCPVDVEWVEREIVWCEPGENAPAAEVRERLGLPDEGDEGAEAQGAQLAAETAFPGLPGTLIAVDEAEELPNGG